MKAKREFADEAFRRKREEWFATAPGSKNIEDLIESTISQKKGRSVKED